MAITKVSNSLLGLPVKEFGTSSIMIGDTTTGTIDAANNNVGLGVDVFNDLTSGDDNIAVGFQAGFDITTGSQNILIGKEAGHLYTTGTFNVGVGHQALGPGGGSAGTGSHNVGVGYGALYKVVTHGNNTAVGSLALVNVQQNDNTAVGKGCLYDQSTGDSNTAMGHEAIENLTTGIHTVGIGRRCASNTTTGSYNVFVGANNQTVSASGSSQVVLGYGVTSQGGGYCTIGNSGSTYTYIDIGTTTWQSSSDERLKKEITDSTAGLSFINDLRPVTFKWKEKGELDSSLNDYVEGSTSPVIGEASTGRLTKHGFIAQEVKAVIDNHPEIKDGAGIWKEAETQDAIQGFSPSALIPMLVKAIQELSAEIETLKENNND
jgi:hypothetical protein